MRAPARAQDLILAHRVQGYRVGDLERRYPRLGIEEAYFVNYGFLPRDAAALLHPRESPFAWNARMHERAQEVLDFVRRHGPTRSREVQAHFDHGRVRWWGSELNAGTQLLEGLHHRGLLRVAQRESGVRVYEAIARPQRSPGREIRLTRAARLLDMAVQVYAPLPASSLVYLARLLRLGAPHLATEVRQVQAQAQSRYSHAEVDGRLWFWPQGENPASARHQVDDCLRFLTPFDPVIWDRRRFELFWGWQFKMEAYLPEAKRLRGHYAMPLLWGEELPGWANLKVVDGRLRHRIGFIGERPRSPAFDRALEQALDRMREFLNL